MKAMTMRVKERSNAMVKRVRPRTRGWVFEVRRMELNVLDIVAGSRCCGRRFGCVLLDGLREKCWEAGDCGA